MRKMRKLLAIILSVTVALTMGLAMTSLSFAAATEHTVSTASTTHTYQIYQIFTGEKSGNQLVNLKYGKNAKTGTEGNSVKKEDMATLATIEKKTYSDDQAKITDLTPFVDLSTTPIATIGKGKDSSAKLAEGYYIIKDTDNSLSDPETYTLYLFKVLDGDLTITPKDGTTTVDKKVTETNDTTATVTADQKGADYDEGDSIPYTIEINLAKNVTDYKHYTVALTDTLSEGLTPPAKADVVAKIYDKDGAEVTTLGTPTVNVNGQVITVSYEQGTAESTTALGSNYAKLNEGKIVVTYSAVLNSKAKKGEEGNPNTYTITYSNNPNGNDTGVTHEKTVKVFTYDLTIEKVDGNNQPLSGAAFTLYKEVAGTTTGEGDEATTTYPEGAQTGAAIKERLNEGVNASKLADGKYYVPITMAETVGTEKVTHKTSKTIDAGKYVLIETTVPSGYNAYAGMDIELTSTIDADGNLTGLTATPTSLTVKTDKSGAEGTVKNDSGATLPSTGGIGTTIFYILGALLVIGCGIVLVARRRMTAK